jgi:hypothetical protein
MDLINLKNLSEGLGGEDVNLNMPHEFRAFIHQLHPEILWLLLASQFLQHVPKHLGDLASITSIMLELENILVWKTNP